MKSAVRIILWIADAGFGLLGALMLSGALDHGGTDAAGRGLAGFFGTVLLIIAAIGAVPLLFVRAGRGALIIAGVVLALPLLAVAVLSITSSINSARHEQEDRDLHTGRTDFANQPALLAIAQAIARNDQAAIRAAAKNVPDLQAPGVNGMTLLYFAVQESLQRPELVDAVETLLSLGAKPNFTNEHAESYSMARAVDGSLRLMRVMLDAGGNPNGRDPQGKPLILNNWQMVYFEGDRGPRFALLLDRGADVNATFPNDDVGYRGYTLAMYRAGMGRGDGTAYRDTLALLKRGADFKRVAADGTTLASVLLEADRWFTEQHETVAPEFLELKQWLAARGVALAPSH